MAFRSATDEQEMQMQNSKLQHVFGLGTDEDKARLLNKIFLTVME